MFKMGKNWLYVEIYLKRYIIIIFMIVFFLFDKIIYLLERFVSIYYWYVLILMFLGISL